MVSTCTSRVAHLRHAAFPIVLAILAVWLPVSRVTAADLQVTPINLDLGPQQQAEAIWVVNNGTAPMRAQVRVQAWGQENDQDQLTPTRDLVASPAAVEVAPGARQLVRIIRLQPGPAPRERSYRVLVDELPGPRGEGQRGVRFMLRYSIPLFIAAAAPDGAAAPAPATADALSAARFTLETAADGQQRLRVSNSGARRIKLSRLALVAADGHREIINDGLLGYALAGRDMAWNIGMARPLAPGQSLEAVINDDPDAQPLPLVNAGR